MAFMGTAQRLSVGFVDSATREPIVPTEYTMRAQHTKYAELRVEIDADVEEVNRVWGVFVPPRSGEWKIVWEVTEPRLASHMEVIEVESTIPPLQ